MTRRTPSEVLNSYSYTPSFAPTLSHRPAAAPAPTPVSSDDEQPRQHAAASVAPIAAAPAAQTKTNNESESSRHFLLADMEGRSVKENRACAACISGLADNEVGQVNWHLADQECRLCQVAACKPEAFTKPFCDFLRENPTVFHTVDHFKSKLSRFGFEEVRDSHALSFNLQASSFLKLLEARQSCIQTLLTRSVAPRP